MSEQQNPWESAAINEEKESHWKDNKTAGECVPFAKVNPCQNLGRGVAQGGDMRIVKMSNPNEVS